MPEVEDGRARFAQGGELDVGFPLRFSERGGTEEIHHGVDEPPVEPGDAAEVHRGCGSHPERVADVRHERPEPPDPDAGDPAEDQEFPDAGPVFSPARP
jgi:hypothetical protein